ncbi:DsrE family protein [Sphingobium sp. AP49]|uniref:DsrE family protein n=1 Tax=Sphingobium sp. AP49 TaxID=1144307 RepID=UPI00026ECB3E|nr:DsrE family protein [Sphingobium sp. AP49]WHO39915.1 DsrE family protein [Sphingobium sp. AP49]
MTADAERLRGALVMATAQAALGGDASLFLQLDAVALLAPPLAAPEDAAHRATGLPTLAELLAEALDMGVVLIACQSGLALSGLSADTLPTGMEVGGPLSFLQQTGDDARLLIA